MPRSVADDLVIETLALDADELGELVARYRMSYIAAVDALAERQQREAAREQQTCRLVEENRILRCRLREALLRQDDECPV